MLKKVALACMISLNSILISGQNTDKGPSDPQPLNLSVDGSVRYRFEHWNNMNIKNYADDRPTAFGKLDDNLLYQRLIFGLTATNKKLSASFHIQDSRAFGWSLRNAKYPKLFQIGDASGHYTMNPSEEFFEIYDANVEVRDILPHLNVKIGRQKIFCADSRIFGPGDWGNTGRWNWDAVKLSYQKKSLSFDTWAGGTKIQDPLKIYMPFTHTEFYGAGFYGTYNYRHKTSFEGYAAYKRQGSADYIKNQQISLYWLGVRIASGDSIPLVYEINAVKQSGSYNQVASAAWGLFLKAGYRLNLPLNPVVTVRYSYASGNKPETPVNESFDPVFGAGDKYYGWMNLIKWTNLDDREIFVELSPIKQLNIELKYNRYNIPQPANFTVNGTLKLKPDKHFLGEEWNIFAKYKHSARWQFVLASGVFVPREVEYINNKMPGNAFWFAAQAEYFINYRVHRSKTNQS